MGLDSVKGALVNYMPWTASIKAKENKAYNNGALVGFTSASLAATVSFIAYRSLKARPEVSKGESSLSKAECIIIIIKDGKAKPPEKGVSCALSQEEWSNFSKVPENLCLKIKEVKDDNGDVKLLYYAAYKLFLDCLSMQTPRDPHSNENLQEDKQKELSEKLGLKFEDLKTIWESSTDRYDRINRANTLLNNAKNEQALINLALLRADDTWQTALSNAQRNNPTSFWSKFWPW